MELALNILLIVNITNYDIGNAPYAVCDELGIEKKIYIVYLPESNMPIEGFTYINFDDSFTIFVKRGIANVLAIRTILHELVHIRQIIDGRLIYLDDIGETVIWEGMKYYKRDQFNPWELEANKLSQRLHIKHK